MIRVNLEEETEIVKPTAQKYPLYFGYSLLQATQSRDFIIFYLMQNYLDMVKMDTLERPTT